MLPLLSGLLTGGASLLGSVFQSQTSAENTQAQIQAQIANQAEAQRFNAEQAALARQFNSAEAGAARSFNYGAMFDNMNWQERMVLGQRAYETQMSNTAYQRARADMERAGLNPILAAGAPASTPSSGVGGVGTASGPSASGPSASTSAPQALMPQNRHPLADIGQAVGQVVNSAISVKTYDKLTEEIASLRAQQAKTAAETETEQARPEYIRSQTVKTGAETETERERPREVRERAGHTSAEIEKIFSEMPEAVLRGTTARDILSMPDWLRRSLIQGAFTANKADDMLAPFLNTAKGVLPWLPRKTTREGSMQKAPDGSWDQFWTERTGWSK